MSSANHPSTQHVCQELHQAIWTVVPAHDLMLAFPCCQGHSRARGKASGNPQHDAIRSTAWSVVSAAEFHSPAFAVIENVPKFPNWLLYPAWHLAMEALGHCRRRMSLTRQTMVSLSTAGGCSLSPRQAAAAARAAKVPTRCRIYGCRLWRQKVVSSRKGRSQSKDIGPDCRRTGATR